MWSWCKPFFPKLPRSTLHLILYTSSLIYFGSSHLITDVITSIASIGVINWTNLEWHVPATFLRPRSLQIGIFGPLKWFWTPFQHRRHQIPIKEPTLVFNLYPDGQYSIHKIPSDNHKWRHESTNQMKFVDATSKIRVQKAKCHCEGIFGIKVRFGKQPFDCSTYEEIIYSFFTTL